MYGPRPSFPSTRLPSPRPPYQHIQGYDTCSRLGSLVGVPEDEDNRVAPQEELGDVALLVLLRAYTWRDRCVSAWVYTHTHTHTHIVQSFLPPSQSAGQSVSRILHQRTGLAFLPLPDLGTSVHISFTFSSSLNDWGLWFRIIR